MAEWTGFSARHFGRIFSGAFGEAPSEFMRRLRLERAASALQTGGLSVTEIAFDAGYETLEAFLKAFRLAYHVNPGDFRESARDPRLQCPSGVHWEPCPRDIVPVLMLHPLTTMEAIIKQQPELRLLCLRHIGPYNEIGAAFGTLLGWAGRQGLSSFTTVARYYDDPGTVPPSELRSDACAIVPADFVLPESLDLPVFLSVIPAGEYASVMHKGSYKGLGDAWARFMGQAFPALGRKEGEVCLEIYHSDCSNTPEDELLTEILQELAPEPAKV